MSKLDKIAENIEEYDEESIAFVNSLKFIDHELDELRSMKRTAGWKIIDTKVREELHARIRRLVENDPEIKTLLAFLKVADTKSLKKILDKEIDAILPDE